RQRCASRLMSRLAHLEQQVRDMLIFARGETRLAEELCADTLVLALESAIEGIKPAASSGVMLKNDVSTDCRLMCNRDALVGACTNLVNNSLEAGAPAVVVQVTLDVGELLIRVVDNGPGFAKDDASRLTEAFYTTKSHGTGLGLAVVQAVVKAHQGRFSIESPEQGGAVATLRLPLLRNKV
ncbi:hypothetical protein LCGC14_1502060, partial [marine sediment metagenome]